MLYHVNVTLFAVVLTGTVLVCYRRSVAADRHRSSGPDFRRQDKGPRRLEAAPLGEALHGFLQQRQRGLVPIQGRAPS